jgi:hypothetical protein
MQRRVSCIDTNTKKMIDVRWQLIKEITNMIIDIPIPR